MLTLHSDYTTIDNALRLQPPAGPGSARLSRAEEDALAALARTGDNAAFTRLYENGHPALLGYVRKLVGWRIDPENAADLEADVWLRAWQALPNTQPDTRWRPWLYTIAHNQVIEWHRHHTLLDWQPWETFVSVFHPSQVARENPEHDVLGDETCAEVRAVLARLSPKSRAVLLLTAQGRSYDEMATILGGSHARIKSLLFRAREQCRQLWPEPHTGAPPPPPALETCEHCGEPFERVKVKRGQASVCSQRCSYGLWRGRAVVAHVQGMQELPPVRLRHVPGQCGLCGAPLRAQRASGGMPQRWCSALCCRRASRLRGMGRLIEWDLDGDEAQP